MTQESDVSIPTLPVNHRAIMARELLLTYKRILDEPESEKQPRFAALIEVAMKLIDETTLYDQFSVTRATLNRWATEATMPGPLAHEAIIRRLRELVDSELS